MIALSAPSYACIFSYTWVPSWVSVATWLCLVLAAFSVNGRVAFWLLLLSVALLVTRLGNLIPIVGPTCLYLVYCLEVKETSLSTLLARILLLPVLGYFAVVGGLWVVGVPPTITQACTICPSNLKNLATATQMYATDHKGAYPANLSQLVPDYLRELPQCLGGKAVSREARVFFRCNGLELADGYGYRLVTPKRYVLWCRSRGYADHTQRFQPCYESGSGLHHDLEGWLLRDGPGLQAQLDKGPPDDLVLRQSEAPDENPPRPE